MNNLLYYYEFFKGGNKYLSLILSAANVDKEKILNLLNQFNNTILVHKLENPKHNLHFGYTHGEVLSL